MDSRTRRHPDNHRVGVDFLRHCLGLPPTTDTKWTSELLNDYLTSNHTLKLSKYEDPVFVCIDTEGTIREIGISILDTRDLKNLTSDSVLSGAISTYNYIIQKDNKAEMKRPFNFGTSERLGTRWIRWLLTKILRTESPDASQKEPWSTILVGHNLGPYLQELRNIRKGKFNIDALPHVLILDT